MVSDYKTDSPSNISNRLLSLHSMPFDTPDLESFFDTLVGWMSNDLQGMIDKDSNYAAVLCLLTYAEALGRLRNGKLGQKDPSNRYGRDGFKYFFGKMGRTGYTPSESDTIYNELRNGMSHSYIPNWRTNFIMARGARGFDITNPSSVKVEVLTAFEEFKVAIPKVKADIKSNPTPVIVNLRLHPYVTSQPSLSFALTMTSGSTSPLPPTPST